MKVCRPISAMRKVKLGKMPIRFVRFLRILLWRGWMECSEKLGVREK